MGKGFGIKSEEQLGYLLLLVPEAKAYAAKLSIDDGSVQEFIGITNILESAQIWKTIKQAKQAMGKYADELLEEAEKASQSQVRVGIRRLKRSVDGKLINEPVESLFLVRRDS